MSVYREYLRTYVRGENREYSHPWETTPCLLPDNENLDIYTARKSAELIFTACILYPGCGQFRNILTADYFFGVRAVIMSALTFLTVSRSPSSFKSSPKPGSSAIAFQLYIPFVTLVARPRLKTE